MNFTDFFKNAEYVCSSEEYHFPYIRKSFSLPKVATAAKIYISALGFCEIYINGKKITDDLFITPLSEYNPQTPEDVGTAFACDPFFSDELSYTVYVSEFDALPFLREGDNAIGVILAGGWYRTGFDKHGGFRNFGKTKVCFRLETVFSDGSKTEVFSDGDCLWHESFLTQSGVFHEEHDERKEIPDFSALDFDCRDWKRVETAAAPKAEYRLCDCPPDRVIRRIKPVLIKVTEHEKIYDVGENITGFPIVKGKSEPGDEIVCVYSEMLDENGDLDEFHSYKQNSVFVSDGRESRNIRFTWHGFRYFSISANGKAGELYSDECAVVYADIRNTSTFFCSDETLNFIYDAYVRSQLENFHCGVPTDCPQIERKGYTGDGQLLCELGMTLFDSRKLYRKWMRDIADVQDKKTGFVHYTAPCFVGCSGGVGGWSVAIINVPYAYYKIYGDGSVLREYYGNMKLFVSFMNSESKDGLIRMHKRSCRCLGDWSGPQKPYLPEDFVNSCLFVDSLTKLEEIAVVCGKNEDAFEYEAMIERIKAAIDANYFEKSTGDYCGNVQGANAFALNIGLGDKRTATNTAAKYGAEKCFDTGIFATKILPKVLFENGYADVAISLLTSKAPVSFYSWMKSGATTLYESWENARSLNHPMFGSVVMYLFEYILGIRQTGESGYKRVTVNPLCTEFVKSARGSLETECGRICVSYAETGCGVEFTVEIPENTDCVFEYKGFKKILKNGINKFTVSDSVEISSVSEAEKGEKKYHEKTF